MLISLFLYLFTLPEPTHTKFTAGESMGLELYVIRVCCFPKDTLEGFELGRQISERILDGLCPLEKLWPVLLVIGAESIQEAPKSLGFPCPLCCLLDGGSKISGSLRCPAFPWNLPKLMMWIGLPGHSLCLGYPNTWIHDETVAWQFQRLIEQWERYQM